MNRNITKKEYEDASLFKEFVRIINGPKTGYPSTKPVDDRWGAAMVKRAFSDAHRTRFSPEAQQSFDTSIRFNQIDHPKKEAFHTFMTPSSSAHASRPVRMERSASMDRASSAFRPFHGLASTDFEPARRVPIIPSHRASHLDGNDRMQLQKDFQQGVHLSSSPAEDRAGRKEELFQLNETDQGFVCLYCEARYIYKRCLVNHLLKSHRKLMKSSKFPNMN